jgi:hypothetical protein
MAMDQFKAGETPDSISARLLATNFRRSSLPARKDTIAVPSNGYAAVRFRADNPGETPLVPLQKDKTSEWVAVCVILRTGLDVLVTAPQIPSRQPTTQLNLQEMSSIVLPNMVPVTEAFCYTKPIITGN